MSLTTNSTSNPFSNPASSRAGNPTTESTQSSVRPASGLETTLMLIGGTWLIVGLFVDGYAHTEIIDNETEDFFTPWHALFYSGFLFTTGVIAAIAYRRADPTVGMHSLPVGYRGAAIGLVVFAAGGVGDGIWHTAFGVESGLDALLSPTHLLLFIGMVAILTAPARARWSAQTPLNGWRQLGPVVVSAAITTALVAFFFVYAFGLFNFLFHQTPYDPSLIADGEVVNERLVQLGLARAYVATTIVLVPTLLFVRRWVPPFGSIAIMWATPVLLAALAFDGVLLTVAATAVGGLVFEMILRRAQAQFSVPTALRLSAAVGTGALWSIWLALGHWIDGPVAWPTELWSGQVGMSALFAYGLAFLATQNG